jgi:hypothetical protein
MRAKTLLSGFITMLMLTGLAFAEKPANQKPLLLDPMQQIDIEVENWLRTLPSAPAGIEGAQQRLERAPLAVSATATGYYKCFPTCTENDGRMLSIAGDGLETLVGTDKTFKVVLPDGWGGDLEIGVFDGDTGGTWDLPRTATAAQLLLKLYTDPNADGLGDALVWTANGATMPNNAWATATIPVDGTSQTPSGTHRWVLAIQLTNLPAAGVLSNFKLRSNGAILVAPDPFAFTAPLFGALEGNILYPAALPGNLGPSTYDGTWTFHLDIVEGLGALEIWDGDFDRGSWNGTNLDDDDSDTDGLPDSYPSGFDTNGFARPEGIAWSTGCTTEASATGCPADDRSVAAFLRTPAVKYEVICPSGAVAVNDNPSGNQEWERFIISSPAPATGSATVHLYGTDLSNLNALRFPVDALCVDDLGNVCEVDRPYLIGDTVFRDDDGDGVQDPGELGIPGVKVLHVNEFGQTVATDFTDANGIYSFDVEAGTHKVVIDSSNFDPGMPLSGLVSTTGGETQVRDVVDANNLDFDFGYEPQPTGGQGCTPGYWKQTQHFDSWPSQYTPTQGFEPTFTVDGYDKSLLQALSAGGGGKVAFGRHAVAGLLNAASPGVNYKFTVAEVITMVQNAFATGNYDAAKNLLEAENESGCPLN